MTSIRESWAARAGEPLRGPESLYYLGWLDALRTLEAMGDDQALTDLAVQLHSETLLAEAEMYFEHGTPEEHP